MASGGPSTDVLTRPTCSYGQNPWGSIQHIVSSVSSIRFTLGGTGCKNSSESHTLVSKIGEEHHRTTGGTGQYILDSLPTWPSLEVFHIAASPPQTPRTLISVSFRLGVLEIAFHWLREELRAMCSTKRSEWQPVRTPGRYRWETTASSHILLSYTQYSTGVKL